MQASDDAALWLAAMSGTASAFASIYDRHRPAVFRKAYARLGTAHDAEDAVAIVFLEAWRKRAQVRIVNGSVLPWLLTTTTYVCLNHTRARRRHREALERLGPAADNLDHTEMVEEEIAQLERAKRLGAAMAKLSARDQMLLEICIVESTPLAEAAALLDLPVGTVKSRLSRARAKLRVDLSDLERPASMAPPTTGGHL